MAGVGDGGGGGRSVPRYAPDDPKLPKPWRGLVDGRTGYLYYWNPETNVTQYERPLHPEEALPPPPPPLPPPHPLSRRERERDLRDRDRERDRERERERDRDRNRHRDRDRDRDRDRETYRSQARDRSRERSRERDHDRRRRSPSGEEHSFHSRSRNRHGDVGGSDSRDAVAARGYRDSERVKSYLPDPAAVEAYRRQNEITIVGDNVPAPYTTFESTGFPSEILKEIRNAGFKYPTPIQSQSWPIALQSHDLVAIAKTGSGKTLGYLIPAFISVKRLQKSTRMGPTVLVLAPTRELATQIQIEAVKFGKSSKISCTCLYGGAPKGPQLRDLDRGVDIVVATPGRLNDILEMQRVSLRQVSYLVLDEADRMLDMGFEPQIRKIVKEVPHRRQTLMFTATWPKEVRKIAEDLLVHPVQVNIGSADELVANTSITQHVELITPIEKLRRLEQILRSQNSGAKVLIFCTTKRMCDQLSRSLSRHFATAVIHGDKSQVEREKVLSQFRSGRSPILVATDVAARGLDIKDIRVVINYDFPTCIEDYVHRIGRTGRAGASGESFTFFTEQDSKYAKDLIKILEGANQHVPRELRSFALRGGQGGRSRRWGSRTRERDWGLSSAIDNNSFHRGKDRASLEGENNTRRHADYQSQARYNYGEAGASDAKYAGTVRRRSHSRSESDTHAPSPKRHCLSHETNQSRSPSWSDGQGHRSRSRSVSHVDDQNVGIAGPPESPISENKRSSQPLQSNGSEHSLPEKPNSPLHDNNSKPEGDAAPHDPEDGTVAPSYDLNNGNLEHPSSSNCQQQAEGDMLEMNDEHGSSPPLQHQHDEPSRVDGEEEEEGMIPAYEDAGVLP